MEENGTVAFYSKNGCLYKENNSFYLHWKCFTSPTWKHSALG